MNGFALALSVLVLQSHPGDVHFQKALQELARGNAALAEASAREALARSLRFAPEEEIEVRPDKGLLFDEMILRARESYRARRARYFRALADALAAQERWPEARKSYRRAMEIEPSPDLTRRMAEHPDLALSERLALLLDAYLGAAPAERSRLEAVLLDSASFRTRNALKASLDRRRFGKLQSSYPELELLDSHFPDFQAATNAGTLIPKRLFQAGVVLIVYFPADSCTRCSEELDGIVVPVLDAKKRQRLIEVAAFVPERELEVLRRIARLLALPVGVGRNEGLPGALSVSAEGEIRVVAHDGLTQIRVPLTGLSAPEIRRRVDAVLKFFEEPALPTEAEPEDASVPLVRVPRGGNDLKALIEAIGVVEKLEAGPAPLPDFYDELSRLTQRSLAAGDRETAFQILARLSRLRGANVAKTRALAAVGERFGERLLERAQSLDPTIKRTPAGESGILFLSTAEASRDRPRRLYLQRSLETDDEVRSVDAVFDDSGGDVELSYVALQEREPLGVRSADRGGAFLYGCAPDALETCRGVRLVDRSRVVFEGEPATLIEGRVYRIQPALVDEELGPSFYQRVDAEGDEGALERGLALFASGEFAAAAAAFEEASTAIDARAPYDGSDLVYNRARALDEQGKRQEALALYRSLGDVSYQVVVDERARAIESGR